PSLDQLEGRYQVVTYDGRGRGASAFGTATHSLKVELDDIDAIRSALKAEKVTLLGHDNGGLLALAYASQHPEHVSGVILVSTPARVVRYGTSNQAKRMIPEEYLGDISELDAKHAWFSSEAWLAYRHVALEPGYVYDPKAAPLLSLFPMAPVARHAVERSLGSFDVNKTLSRLPIKVVSIYGERAAVSDGDRRVYEKAPNSSCITIPKTGHYPHLERPEQFAEAVLQATSRLYR
ncbi:MAG: alpha/beta hydrolase, partial [Myxococcota bacterium]|nr:alpha/beta hydrolase [Myxococcota bacterium]